MSIPSAPHPVPASTAPCPCGSGRTFGDCCQPVLSQQRPAADAEQLMRSRFTAHYIGDYEHLHRSYLETTSKPYVPEAEEGEPLQWTRLVIHKHEPGPRPDVAYVEFSAFFKAGDGEQPLEERSEFRKIDGKWIYARTVRQGPPPAKAAPKVGRNDPCPCGSGKKYKHCHGK